MSRCAYRRAGGLASRLALMAGKRGRQSPGARPLRLEPLEQRSLLAVQFIDQGAFAATGLAPGSSVGDVNNDGGPDIVIPASDGTKVYLNNGTSVFSDSGAALAGVSYGWTALGDYDNDGWLDILLTGQNGSNSISQVYHNNHNGTFTDIGAGLIGTYQGSCDWGDCDSDGRLDILLEGNTSDELLKVYHNDGSGRFTDLGVNIMAVPDSAAAWGDYDADGRLDILVSGTSTRIYHNDGNGAFTQIPAGLPFGLHFSEWGDYNNDSRLDILVCGIGDTGLYRNNGNGTFTDTGALAGVTSFAAAWGDFDNDGLTDLLLGDTLSHSLVYRNNGDDTFTQVGSPLVNFTGEVAWIDYDNDGRLDILSGGKLYRNDGAVPNTAPEAPSGLAVNVLSPTSVALSWDAPSDGGQTPAGGLSYSLRVGTTPGGSDIVGPMADASGARRLVARGPIEGTHWTLSGLTMGQTYYWSVQAVDTGLVGSPFATEGSFNTVPSGTVLAGTVWNDLNGNGAKDSEEVSLEGWTVFLDSDADGALDAGEPSAVSDAGGAYRFDGLAAGTYTVAEVPQTNWTRTFPANGKHTVTLADGQARLDVDFGNRAAGIYGSVWSDQDGDGVWDAGEPGLADCQVYADWDGSGTWQSYEPSATTNPRGEYALVNLTPGGYSIGQAQQVNWMRTFPANKSGLQAVTLGAGQVVTGVNFGNQPSFPFSAQGSLGLPTVYGSGVAWGDVDNDGRLDVALAGETPSGSRIAKIYRDTGNGSYSDIGAELTGVLGGSVAWADYDNDGWLDLLLTGNAGSGTSVVPVAKLYRNLGNGAFNEIDAGLTGVYRSSATWGDYDNDGRADILLKGDDGASATIAKLYHNNGDNTFTEITAGLQGSAGGAAVWGDYNNDGRLDILLSGTDTSGSRFRIYRNEGNGTFTDINAGYVFDGPAAWGDYDNDGRLDILITGSNGTEVYRNNGNNTFTDINAGLPGLMSDGQQVGWGDYDNDGRLDILVTGRFLSGPPVDFSRVYRNLGDGTFRDVGADLTGKNWGSAGWGDYDRDGRLDILLTYTRSGGIAIGNIYRNNAATQNVAPAAPTGLGASLVSASSAVLSWTAPSDNGQTPVAGLSYNLRVGTTPGGSDLVGPMADAASGSRRLAQRGMIQRTSWTLNNLVFGQRYYWSVQAVDSGLAGSAFAEEGSFLANFISGTEGNDTFQFSSDGPTCTITVNGVARVYDSSMMPEVLIDGLGGNDTMAITGGTGDMTVRPNGSSIEVGRTGYQLTMTSVEEISVAAGPGGNQSARLYDGPGNDTFTGSKGAGSLQYASGSTVNLTGFANVYAYAESTPTDTGDKAELYDSAASTDQYVASPTRARFNYDYLNPAGRPGRRRPWDSTRWWPTPPRAAST